MAKKNMIAIPKYNERKSVDIKKANNGYIVSSWGDKGEKCFITKDKTEAKGLANKLLNL
jgi:hypothetical protein